MWVEFLVGSCPCFQRFSSGYSGFPRLDNLPATVKAGPEGVVEIKPKVFPSPQKPTLSPTYPI